MKASDLIKFIQCCLDLIVEKRNKLKQNVTESCPMDDVFEKQQEDSLPGNNFQVLSNVCCSDIISQQKSKRKDIQVLNEIVLLPSQNDGTESELIKKKKKHKQDLVESTDVCESDVTLHVNDDIDQHLKEKKKKRKKLLENLDTIYFSDCSSPLLVIKEEIECTSDALPDELHTFDIDHNIGNFENRDENVVKRKKKKHKHKHAESELSSADTTICSLKTEEKKKKRCSTEYENSSINLFDVNTLDRAKRKKKRHRVEQESADVLCESSCDNLTGDQKKKKNKHLKDADYSGLSKEADEEIQNSTEENEAKRKKKKHKYQDTEGNSEQLPLSDSISSPTVKKRRKKKKHENLENQDDPGEVNSLRTTMHSRHSESSASTDYPASFVECTLSFHDSSDEDYKTKLMSQYKGEGEDLLHYVSDDLYVPPEVIEKIRGIEIVIDWEVPMLHTIESRVTSFPTKEQSALLSELALAIKKGPFTKEEDELIRKNFGTFCDRHDLPPDPIPFLRFNRGRNQQLLTLQNRINFGRYLARGLDTRLLHTVYKRFQTISMPMHKTGRFTMEEDAFIIENMDKFKHPFVEIARVLSRQPHSILKRFSVLNQGPYSCSWDSSTCEQLLKYLMRVTLVVRVEELKDRQIHEEEWQAVAKKMKIIAMRLKEVWNRKLYSALFIPCGLEAWFVIQETFIRLQNSKVEDWADVKWHRLAKPFDGWTEQYLRRRIMSIKKLVPADYTVRECADYVLQNFTDFHFKEPLRLEYIDGRLIRRN